jgi:hypothetical protein
MPAFVARRGCADEDTQSGIRDLSVLRRDEQVLQRLNLHILLVLVRDLLQSTELRLGVGVRDRLGRHNHADERKTAQGPAAALRALPLRPVCEAVGWVHFGREARSRVSALALEGRLLMRGDLLPLGQVRLGLRSSGDGLRLARR